MSQPFLLSSALCLPAPDIEALIQGQTILALPLTLRVNQQFVLYPSADLRVPLSIDKYYQPKALPQAHRIMSETDYETVKIKAWAVCRSCELLDHTTDFEVFSRLTIWTPDAFQVIVSQYKSIFLAYLQVYQLPEPLQIAVNPDCKPGNFLSLSVNSVTINDFLPVLTEVDFTQARERIQQRKLPLHPELEELQSLLAQISTDHPRAKQLDEDIRRLLGWSSQPNKQFMSSDLVWIKQISKLGDRSIEKEEKKSCYQAGTDFENITKKSLVYLGFQIAEEHKGGAGGLDFYCSKPYPLVGECKAGKLIPSGTVEELLKLGGMHLGTSNFQTSPKIVIGPGNPSSDTLKSSQQWRVSIINPMTLENLVELQSQYPGSVDLIELKKYLEPGKIDHRIDEYIEKVRHQIKIRSHVVQVLKTYLELTKYENVGVEGLHGSYMTSNPPQSLDTRDLHELLIELSSPLTGYIGRIKGESWESDRFYFLRDFPIE